MTYPTNEYLAGLAGLCTSIAGAVLFLWRKQSKTKLEVKADTIQGNVLDGTFRTMIAQYEAVEKDRDYWKSEAHESRNAHMEVMGKMHRLDQENETLRNVIKVLQSRVDLLERKLGIKVTDSQAGDLN